MLARNLFTVSGLPNEMHKTFETKLPLRMVQLIQLLTGGFSWTRAGSACATERAPTAEGERARLAHMQKEPPGGGSFHVFVDRVGRSELDAQARDDLVHVLDLAAGCCGWS